MYRGQQILFIGSLGLIIGALLPWATVTSGVFGVSLNVAGYQMYGMVTGALGLVFMIVSMASKGTPGKTYSTPTIVIGVAAILLLASVLMNLNRAVSQADSGGLLTAIGPGLLMSIAGAVLATVGGLQEVPAGSVEEAAKEPGQT